MRGNPYSFPVVICGTHCVSPPLVNATAGSSNGLRFYIDKKDRKVNTQQKLIDLLKDFDTAMLVIRGSDGSLDARPMAVAQVEENGQIWFVTDRNSGKIAGLMLDSEVAVVMQSSNKFVSLSGNARVIDDRAKLNELWKESWKVWFPEGKSSESIVLLDIIPSRGEYWDNSGLQGAKYLLKAGMAYLQGERPETEAEVNASASF